MDVAYIQGEGGFPLKFKLTDTDGNALSGMDITRLFFRVGGVVKTIGNGISYDENEKLWLLTLGESDTQSLEPGVWKAYFYLTPFNSDMTVCKKINLRISKGGVREYE